jgi:sporulation protein YlmC with PRC-barrel domain
MSRSLRTQELRGLKVIGSGGRILGEVKDLEVDVDSWRVENLVLRVHGSIASDLGLPRPRWKRAHLAVPARHIKAGRDVVLLDVTVEAFAEELRAARPADEPGVVESDGESSSV